MVTLNTVTLDDSNGGTAPPLLIAHGLFGSARNWGVLTKRLADRGPVTAVDMRNHGASPWSDDHGYPALAGDLAATIAELPGGRADVIGHSMGGKAAMTAALAHPDLVRRLIVADIAPVAYGHSQNHLIRAMREIDLSQVTRRSEADAQLAVHVTEAPVRAFLLQSLDVAGKCWTLNLDVLEAQMAQITGWHAPQGRFDGPALFLSGEQSDYVTPAHHAAIKEQFPQATFQSISGAGHWLHAERPREVESAVRTFLDG